MARFYRIQIDSIVLSRDGETFDDPCELEIANLEDLQTDWYGLSFPSASGKRISQSVEATDTEFEIKITRLYQDIYQNLRAAANANLALQAAESDANFTVTGTGDTGDFSIDAVWNPQKPFSAGGFINGRIENVTLRFIRKIGD